MKEKFHKFIERRCNLAELELKLWECHWDLNVDDRQIILALNIFLFLRIMRVVRLTIELTDNEKKKRRVDLEFKLKREEARNRVLSIRNRIARSKEQRKEWEKSIESINILPKKLLIHSNVFERNIREISEKIEAYEKEEKHIIAEYPDLRGEFIAEELGIL